MLTNNTWTNNLKDHTMLLFVELLVMLDEKCLKYLKKEIFQLKISSFQLQRSLLDSQLNLEVRLSKQNQLKDLLSKTVIQLYFQLEEKQVKYWPHKLLHMELQSLTTVRNGECIQMFHWLFQRLIHKIFLNGKKWV